MEIMETKEMKIQAPEGYEIDKENSTFEKIVFRKIDNNLPKSWKEFGEVEGWFVNNRCEIDYYDEGDSTNDMDKNLFPTEEEAEACIALSQLCQLRDRYNDGWKPDWNITSETKYVIEVSKNTMVKNFYGNRHKILAFKTEELRDKFLENFRDLIEIAKPLL